MPNANVGLRGIAHMLLTTPMAAMWLQKHGYMPQGIDPRFSAIRNFHNGTLATRSLGILRQAFYGDEQEKLIKIADAALVLLGVPPEKLPTDKKRQWIMENLPQFALLIYQFGGPEFYNSLLGSKGSTFVLAQGIFNAYAEFGIDSQSAVNLATALSTILSDKVLSQGFTNVELSGVLSHAVKAGLLLPTLDANQFIKQVVNILPLYRTAIDTVQQQQPNAPITAGLKLVEDWYKASPGIEPSELSQRVLAQQFILQRAPGGLFQAGVQAAGVQLPITPHIYVPLDKKLRENAAESPLANIIGATRRAVEKYNVGGLLGKLYSSIQQGNMPYIMASDWVRIATASGLPANVALAVIRQDERNKAFITPKLLQVIRANQYKYDIQPQLTRIFQLYRDPETRRGAIAKLAKKYGYSRIGELDPGQVMLFMHSNLINGKSLEILRLARDYARQTTATAYIGKQPLLSRFMDVLTENQPLKLKDFYKVIGVPSSEYEGIRQVERDIGKTWLGKPTEGPVFGERPQADVLTSVVSSLGS